MRNKTRIFLIFMSALALFSACKDTLDISPDRDGRHETVELRFNIGCGSVGSPSATATRSSGDKALPVSKVWINDSTIAEISVESTDLSLSSSRGTRGTPENPPGGETDPFSSSPDTVPAPGIEINEKCGTYYIVAYKSGKWHGVVKGRMEKNKFKITKKLGFDSNNTSLNPHVIPGEYDFACINGAVAVDDSCKNICVRQPEAGVALIGMKRVKIDSKSGQHDVNMILHGFGSRIAVDLLDYRYKSHFTGKIDVQGEIVTDHSLITELFTDPDILEPDSNGFLKYVKATLDGHPRGLGSKMDIHPLPLKVNGFNQINDFSLSGYLLGLDWQSREDIIKMAHGYYNGRYYDFTREKSSAFVNDPYPVELDAGSSFFKMFGNLWCVSAQTGSFFGEWPPLYYNAKKRASLLYDFYLYSASNDWKLAVEKSFPEFSQPEIEYAVNRVICDITDKMAGCMIIEKEEGSSLKPIKVYNNDLLVTKIVKPYDRIDPNQDEAERKLSDYLKSCFNTSDRKFIYNSMKYYYYGAFIANYSNIDKEFTKTYYDISHYIGGGDFNLTCLPAIYQSVPFKYVFPGSYLNDLKFRFTQGKGLAGKTVSLMKATGEAAKEIEPGKFYHFIIKFKSASEKYPGRLDPVE